MKPTDVAKMRLKRQHERSKQQLVSGLKSLRANIEAALKGLERGENVDEYLITNSVVLTVYIAQYNIAIDLLPLHEENMP